MAQFLIKAVCAKNSCPIKDKSCYKSGDIVYIADNDHIWGNKEGLPTFYIIIVPEIDHTKVLHLLQSDDDVRRKYRINLNSISPEFLLELQSTGTITIDNSAFESCLNNKRES
jgi:hypothetical protein